MNARLGIVALVLMLFLIAAGASAIDNAVSTIGVKPASSLEQP